MRLDRHNIGKMHDRVIEIDELQGALGDPIASVYWLEAGESLIQQYLEQDFLFDHLINT